MATLSVSKVAQSASFAVFALIGVGLIGLAPVAVADVSAPAHVSSYDDPDLDDPAPLIQDPPGIQSPTNPGQKTLGPTTHRRSRHRAPTST